MMLTFPLEISQVNTFSSTLLRKCPIKCRLVGEPHEVGRLGVGEECKGVLLGSGLD